jgi:hypothetical protein
MPQASVIWQSNYEVDASGPDGANRLLICQGMASLGDGMSPKPADPMGSASETWTFRVGPRLPHPQFHRAMATVSVASQSVYYPDTPTVNSRQTYAFRSIEADWDDESTQTEVRVELHMETGPVARWEIHALAFNVTILAEHP